MMIKARVAKSIFWLVWSRGFIQIASFFTTLVVARLLEPSDYGLMALAGAWTGILMMIWELGLGAAIMQFRKLEDGELNLCFYFMNTVAWLTYGSLYAAAPLIAAWFNNTELSAVLRATGLILPIGALQGVQNALLRKRLQFDRLTKAEMLAAAVGIGCVFILAQAGLGVWALVAGMLSKSAVGALAVMWSERWQPSLVLKFDRFRQIINFSIASFGSRVLWATYHQSDSFVLGKVSGDAMLGLYTMARDLASLPVVKVSSVVNELAYPVMAELQENRRAMAEALLRAVRLVASLSFPVCIGMALVAQDAVRLILTDKWLPIVPLLQVLCVSGLVKSIDVLFTPVLRARHRVRFLAGYNFALLASMPALFLVGAWWSDGLGVAVVWALAYPPVMAWMARETLREIDLGWCALFSQLRMPFTAALAMSLIVIVIQNLLPGTPQSAIWMRLAASVIAGGFIYASVLWFWGGQVATELRELVRWIFSPRRGILAP